ncbi:MAG TPA: ASCH domain-containing protein [Crocinitomicaceae bacterium]|nr:ASCH domain-containing protein [Crocinitomicaceae bacterium]
MKILHLTLTKKWFDMMVTGEKNIEVRKPSKWIMSRLENKEYDVVKFTNGYGKDKPWFIAEYKGWRYVKYCEIVHCSDALAIHVPDNSIVIQLGKVIQKSK